MAEELSSDLILLTETHLSLKIESSEITIKGWQDIQSDRLQRLSGGSLIYIRDSLTVTDKEAFSNDYVEMSLGFIPSQETAVIVVYRPPHCPSEKFKDTLLFISNWIKTIEKEIKKTPVILIGGDLNFPFLKTWSPEDIEVVTANGNARSDNNSAVGSERSQAIMMIDLMSELALNQEVMEGTREKNILDVIMTNDEELIENIEVFENLQISDHKFVIAKLSKPLSLGNDIKNKKINYCSTTIPEFDLYKPDPQAWAKAREQFRNIDFNLDDELEDLANNVISNLENVVNCNFSKRAPPDRSNQQSKNLIPREVRTLMKQKINANRSLAKETEELKINSLKEKNTEN